MGRRVPSPAAPAPEVDEVEVRLRAAKWTFALAGGVVAHERDPVWWAQWQDRHDRLPRDDREALVAHFETAIARLGATGRYELEQHRCRRMAELSRRPR